MNDLSNCVPSCKQCNSQKHTDSLEEWYNEDNIKYSKRRFNRIHKWLDGDYKKYIIIKEELPYIIKKINVDNTRHYELWSKDENGEPLDCLGNGMLKSDLNVYIEKLIIKLI